MSMAATAVHRATFETLPFGAPTSDVIECFHRDGGVILSDVLTVEEVEQVNAELDPHIYDYHTGSLGGDDLTQEFWGRKTKRVTNTIVLSPTYRERYLANPVIHDYVDAVFKGVSESFWLQSTQTIEIMPGEQAQMLHRDAGNYPVFSQFGPDGPEVTCNSLLALVDTDERCGATRVIPGSHRWDFEREFDASQTVAAELKAGSMFFYSGKLVHGGGANNSENVRRRVISTGFNPGFLVPEEAYPFTVPIDLARTLPARLQQAIGFRSFHQRDPLGGSLWMHNFEELATYLEL